jgi:hypothetical protein
MDGTDEDASRLLTVSLSLSIFLSLSTRPKRLLLLNVITSLRTKFKENGRSLSGNIGECYAGGSLTTHGKFLCYSMPCLLLHSLCKVRDSRKRPGVAQRAPGVLGSQISWHSAHEGGEIVTLTYRPPLPPGMFLVLIFTRGSVDPRAMERSEGNMSLNNPVKPPGIDPGTVRLVAQRLNHYATPGLTFSIYTDKTQNRKKN